MKPVKKDNVVELPIGEFDAVRTLRNVLRAAEAGEIDNVVIVCEKSEDDGTDLWVTWSDAKRENVLWMVRWLNSFVNHRYFAKFHGDNCWLVEIKTPRDQRRCTW